MSVLLEKLKSMCIYSVLLGITITAITGIVIVFPGQYVVGELNEHSSDIRDLRIIAASLPQMQADISDMKDDIKTGFKATSEDIVKLRLIICENSQGQNCN